MRQTAMTATGLIGERVRNHEGRSLGTVKELMLDPEQGRIGYVVMAAGGFLGLGEKLFALPWDIVTFDPDHRSLVVPLSKEIFAKAPGFDRDNWPDFADRGYTVLVDHHFGVELEPRNGPMSEGEDTDPDGAGEFGSRRVEAVVAKKAGGHGRA